MIRTAKFLTLFLCLWCVACTETIVNSSTKVPLNLNTKIAVIPFLNNTETPLAGERAMSVTAAVLKSRGICHVVVYPNLPQKTNLLPGLQTPVSRKQFRRWAVQTHARYILTGTVNEWSYKVGLDGEPVVGLSMRLIDLASNQTVWTAVGSKSDGSRVAVSTSAQKLINQMLVGLLNAGRG